MDPREQRGLTMAGQPLAVLAAYVRQVLDSEYAAEGAEEEDPYAVESVCRVLRLLAEGLAGK